MPVGKELASIAASSSFRAWISVPMAPSITKIRSDAMRLQGAFDVTHGYATFSSLLDEWRLRLSRASAS